jgi:crotonobetainyl-CoA:carnitine CoA-transferase CaiB-like acyl-CoA transferase
MHLSFFGALLAEQGADVIRVEPVGGDPMRGHGPFVGGASLPWAVAARGCRSFACDRTRAEGRSLVGRLLASAHVVAEAADTDRQEWMDPGELRGPACLVRFSGTGAGGPPAPELVALAAGGLLSVTGDPDRAPVPFGVSVAEHLAAVFGATAVAAVLYEGSCTAGDRPVVIEIPTVAAVIRVNEWGLTAVDTLGLDRNREGNRPSRVAPLGVFASCDGNHVAIVGGSDANFVRLVRAMGREDLLADPRFSDVEARAANSEEVNGLVAGWVADLPAEVVERRCLEAGAPVGVVATPDRVLSDPHFLARGDFVTVSDPVVGDHRQPAPHPRLVGSPVVVPAPAPQLGADTVGLLQRDLGLGAEDVARLLRQGVVGGPARPGGPAIPHPDGYPHGDARAE